MNKKGTKSSRNKTKARRPAVSDSLDSTLILCGKDDNIKEKVLEVGSKQAKKHLEFHPIIVCTRDSEGIPLKFYVMIDHFYLEVETFKHAIGTFIQSFFVFDVFYPPEASNVCKFIAEMFYNINSDDATVSTFIKDLKSEKKQLDDEHWNNNTTQLFVLIKLLKNMTM